MDSASLTPLFCTFEPRRDYLGIRWLDLTLIELTFRNGRWSQIDAAPACEVFRKETVVLLDMLSGEENGVLELQGVYTEAQCHRHHLFYHLDIVSGDGEVNPDKRQGHASVCPLRHQGPNALSRA